MSNFLLDNRPTNPLTDAARAMNGDPSGLFNRMYKTNPQFRSFADSVKGKTPEQAFREHGLDFNDVRKRMGR